MFRPGTKPISEVLRGEVSKVDFILKNLSVLHIGDQKSFCLDDILFRRWVLFLFHLTFSKSFKFSNVTYKVKSNILFEKEVKYVSRVTTDKTIATKHKPLLIWAT